MNIKWSKYIPSDHQPHGKQLAFLSLPHLEAFYGGAAGGGKSDALLMAALQYVDQPKFQGIIFRRTYSDMLLPSSILSRCKEWLKPFIDSGEVKYKPGENHSFHFPSGAVLAFGYLQNEDSQHRYASSEYQYIAFDELTHFLEHEYEFLFSRLRRTKDCNVPLRMRAASNPGSKGMRWVRDRFKIKLNEATGLYQGYNTEAPFIPASIIDNPSIDPEYRTSLMKLGKVERERLLNGNWDISEDAIYEKHWFTNRWTCKHNQWYHLLTVDGLKVVHRDELFIFCTVDPAASVKTGVNGRSFIKSRPNASWTVIATWGVTPDYQLLWLDNQRFQLGIPDVVNRVVDNHNQWKPLYTIIEKNGPGEGVYQSAEKRGVPCKPIHTRPEKVINSVSAQLRAERGQIWLPKWENWLPTLEDELFTWTGSPDEIDDQIDVLSNAANEVMDISVGFERDIKLREGLKRALPFASMGSTTPTRFCKSRVIENPYRSRDYRKGPPSYF
jgi:predicted phage terminase large subunit-like protein